MSGTDSSGDKPWLLCELDLVKMVWRNAHNYFQRSQKGVDYKWFTVQSIIVPITATTRDVTESFQLKEK